MRSYERPTCNPDRQDTDYIVCWPSCQLDLTPMISLPLKTTETTKWSTHISSALSAVYGSPSSDFGKEMEAIDTMRDAMMGCSPNSRGMQLLYRYLAQIELISMHIPMKPFKTEFTWHDLYTGEEVKQPSVAFEKVCVYYNLAATLSHVASEDCNREDYKSAYHNFSCAAGILEFAGQSFLYTASIDFESSTLAALSTLMLAQAQHCFYLKAKQSSSGNLGLLAKLAAAAVSLYEDSATKLKALFDEEHWGDKQHIKEVETASKALKCDAQKLQGQHCETNLQKHGEAIAHFKEAKRLCTDKRQVEEFTTTLKALERDNNLIYQERVPAVTPEIKSTQVAKALPLSAVFPEEEARKIVGRDLFERVVPIAVHEKASLYSEMKAQFLREQQEKSEVASLELRSALEYMELPSAISKMRKSVSEIAEVPSDVNEWSTIVASSPPPKPPQFNEQRQRILSLLRSQQNDIDSPSCAVGNIHQIKQSLIAASKSDAELALLYEDLSSKLPMLADTHNLLNIYRARAKAQQQQQHTQPPDISLLDIDSSNTITPKADLQSELDVIASLVAKLHKIQAERQTTLSDLRTKTHHDDITQLIVANQDTTDLEKKVLEPELRKFDPLVRRLDATIRLQKSVLNEIATKWKTLLASPEAKEATEVKQQATVGVNQLTSELKSCYEQWRAYTEGIDHANKFYSDLEHRAFNINVPQPPPKPPKQTQPTGGLSGYTTPSAYNPSMYR